jgi:predicted Zn-dependent protease
MRLHALAVWIVASLLLTAQEPLQPAGDSAGVSKEVAMGRQLADQVRRQTTPLDSPGAQDYVDRLGRRIASHISGAEYPFVFSVIADDPCCTIHEPTALPGGYVFVPAALFLAAHGEDEFAGMIAHAMEHVAQARGTGAVTRSQVSNRASIPLIFTGGCAGTCSGGLAVPKDFVEVQRANAERADALAVQAMARAGFDPAALPRYIERVQPPGSAGRVSLLPDRDERVARMRSLIEGLPVGHYADSGPGFRSIQDEVRRLVNHRSPAARTPPTLRRPDSK